MITLIRYIHENPRKGEIVDRLEKYPYSSYREYYGRKKGITDCDFVYDVLSKKEFIRMHERNEFTPTEESEFEKMYIQISDYDARKIICKLLQSDNPLEFGARTIAVQCEILHQIIEHHVSRKQLSRITGIPYMRIRYLSEKGSKTISNIK